jgi:hypothetical protein
MPYRLKNRPSVPEKGFFASGRGKVGVRSFFGHRKVQVLASLVAISLLSVPVKAFAWSWPLGSSAENVLAVFKKGDAKMKPREGDSTALPCGIYTDFDAHPGDHYYFFSPMSMGHGRYSPEFQFEFRNDKLQAVLITAPYSGTKAPSAWTADQIVPEKLLSVPPRVIEAKELQEKKGIQLPNDAVLIWDYGDRELQVLVFNWDKSQPDGWKHASVAAYFRAYRSVLLDEGKTIPLPLKNPFMQ